MTANTSQQQLIGDQSISSYLARFNSPLYAHYNNANNATFTTTDTGKPNSRLLAATSKWAASLLLKLFNQTYLSLPIINCTSARCQTRGRHVFDVCLVDWDLAKLFRGSIADNEQQTELYLLSDLHLNSSSQRQTMDIITRSLYNTTSQQQYLTNTKTSDYDNLSDNTQAARLTYLSISSLSSIAGMLTNLLIVLIILINTKQRFCSHFLGRTNNSSHHYVLLSQLTLTGLLLAGYILVDNVHIYNRPTIELDANVQTTKVYYCEPPPASLSCASYPDSQLIDISRSDFVRSPKITLPLSAFLPPTPFESNSLMLAPETNQQMANCASSKLFKSNEWLLMFKTKDKLSSAPTDYGHENSSHWYLRIDSQHDEDENFGLKLLDLSETMESIQLIKRSDRLNQTTTTDKKSLDAGSIDGTSSDKLNMINLLMNFIGSIHIWTVAALAYDRYCAIAHPLQYLRSISTNKTRAFLIILWILSIILNLVLPIGFDRLYFADNYYISSQRILSNQNSEIFNSCEPIFIPSANSTRPPIYDQHQDGFTINMLHMLSEDFNLFATNFSAPKLAIAFSDLSAKLYSSIRRQQTPSGLLEDSQSKTLSITLNIVLSLFSFNLVVLIPLVIITICNIRIYGIVKVHERRLSASSGSNNGANGTSSFHINGQRYKRDLMDDRSDTNSLASSILGKLVRASVQVGLFRTISRQDDVSNVSSPCTDQLEGCQLMDIGDKVMLPKNNMNQESTSSNIINRSKRLVARQDSYHLMDKFSTANTNETPESHDHQTNSVSQQQCLASKSMKVHHHLKIKRKMSDHRERHHLTFAPVRKCSLASQPDVDHHHHYFACRDNSETCSGCINYNSFMDTYSQLNNKSYKAQESDDGIMHQLKMAGLSFAGIAINDINNVTSAPNNLVHQHQRLLNRSSSCSLGNLSSMINKQPRATGASLCHQFGPSISRCSMDTTSSVPHGPKRSHVSSNLNISNPKHQQQQQQVHDFNCQTDKYYQGRLIETESDNQYGSMHHISHQTRLPFSLGTKSASFNVVIWLILTMLIFTLPQYLLIIIEQVLRFSSSDHDGPTRQQQLVAYKRLLDHLLQETDVKLDTDREILISSANSTSFFTQSSRLIQLSSIWLSCICRLLFLSMLPLNGWLYGIRSRSLKTTVKMVLRRYISRRQASIEIDQRQKSTSSLKSRDLSFLSLPFCHQQATNSVTNESQNRNFYRTVRRCSSFNGRQEASFACNQQQPLHDVSNRCSRQLVSLNDTNNGSECDKQAAQNSQRAKLNRNSIRFTIGDCNGEKEANSQQLNNSTNQDKVSQNNSLGSLADSNKSLISASIQSSQSAAYLLLDQKFMDTGQLSQSMSEPISSGGSQSKCSKLVGVLKKNHLESSSGFSSGEFNGGEDINSKRKSSNTFSGRTSSLDCYDEMAGLKDEPLNESCSNKHQKPMSSSVKHATSCTDTYDQCYTVNDESAQSNQMSSAQLRKSSNEIKFLLTSDQDESCILDIGKQQQIKQTIDQTAPVNVVVTSNQQGGTFGNVSRKLHPDNRQQQLSSFNLFDWYKQIKQTLARYVLDASASASSYRCNNNQTTNSSLPESPGSCATTTSSIVANEIGRKSIDSTYCNYDEIHFNNKQLFRKYSNISCESNESQPNSCRMSLLRNSLDSHSGFDVLKGQSGDGDSNSNTNNTSELTKKRIRNSLTTGNVGIIGGSPRCKRCKFKSDQYLCANNYNCQQALDGSSGCNASNQSGGANLKPPNFLKLVFGQDNLYSSSLALSPIKECSSNHSYASSQSSLSNNQVVQFQLLHQCQQQQQTRDSKSSENQLGPTIVMDDLNN